MRKERKLAAGELDSFDPTGSYVHPLHRIDNVTPSRSESSLTPPPTSTYSDEDEDDDIGDYADGDSDFIRPTRRRSKIRNGLPFSPKKSSRVVLALTDDDDDDSVRPRRKLRSGQLKLKLTLKPPRRDDDEYGESEVESDEDDEYDDYVSSRYAKVKKAKGKQRAAPKSAKPEYGTVKPIEDIDLDYFSDEEDKALRAHRRFCEKCHLTPAHVQMAAWKRRKGKKKKAKNDEETDDEERIEKLGGWVRWYVIQLARATLG